MEATQHTNTNKRPYVSTAPTVEERLPGYLSLHEAAALLGIGYDTARKRIARHRIPVKRCGSAVLVDDAALWRLWLAGLAREGWDEKYFSPKRFRPSVLPPHVTSHT